MDPAIWSQLPDDLLEHVLSFLPLKTFLNLRSTSKYFNSLIFSPSFASKHNSCSDAFLMLSHPQCSHQHFPLYDFNVEAWTNLFLPLSLDFSNLLSSSNGLFCFSSPSSLVVCNLLSKSSRIIDFPSYPFDLESLTLISAPSSSGYKIFTLFSKFGSSYALVYDSKTQSWNKFDTSVSVLRDSSHQESVFYKGSLYFTTPEPFSVVRFDLEKGGGWQQRNGCLSLTLPSDVVFVRLVSDGRGGKLYLIGGVGRNGISKSLKLWEMDGENRWIEVESLPELMCRKFMAVCYHNYEHVYCFWHQGMICVCCYTWPEVLYYKVSRRTWHWLHKCPSLPDRWSCGFRWFSFVPEIYALV